VEVARPLAPGSEAAAEGATEGAKATPELMMALPQHTHASCSALTTAPPATLATRSSRAAAATKAALSAASASASLAATSAGVSR